MPFPNFDPVLVHIGPLAIRWYAIAYIAGILLGWRYGVALVKDARLWRGTKPPLNEHQVDDLVLWVTLAILLGGRLGSILFYNTSVIWTNPLEILQPWHGGMSFHGAFIAVVIAVVLFARRNGADMVRLGDIVAPCVPFGLFFGRLANFVNGELWGRPTTLPWGIIFPRTEDGIPRHPSQLYEAGLEGIVLFAILLYGTHVRKLLPRRGALTGLFVAFYGLFRILLETVRQPDVGFEHLPFGLTMGMILSVPMVLAGIGFLWWSTRPGALAPQTDEAGEADNAALDATPLDVQEVAADPFAATMPEPLTATPHEPQG